MKPSEIIKVRAEKIHIKKSLDRLGFNERDNPDRNEVWHAYDSDYVAAILDYLDNQEKRIKFLENVVQQLSTKKLA